MRVQTSEVSAGRSPSRCPLPPGERVFKAPASQKKRLVPAPSTLTGEGWVGVKSYSFDCEFVWASPQETGRIRNKKE